MKLLALDTSTELASVALLVGDALYSEEQGSQKMHAQLLLPMIDRLLVQSSLRVHQLDGIVFGCGPGSFTGLRIACSIAKGLAFAHNIPLIPVSCLAAISSAAREQQDYAYSPVLAVLDARMHELYWSYFSKDEWVSVDRVNAVQEIQIPNEGPVVLAGVGIDAYWDDFPASLKAQISTRLTLYPNAATMIRLAKRAAIKPVLAAVAQPLYVRNQVTQGDSRG